MSIRKTRNCDFVGRTTLDDEHTTKRSDEYIFGRESYIGGLSKVLTRIEE
jgi:hypothetical protein